MGYFSNACEGEAYRARFCDRCRFDAAQDCPIWTQHLVDQAEPTLREFLSLAIPELPDGAGNGPCRFFVEADPKPTPGLHEATVEEIAAAIVEADHVGVKCDHFPGRVRYDIDLSADKLKEALNRAGLTVVKENSDG